MTQDRSPTGSRPDEPLVVRETRTPAEDEALYRVTARVFSLPEKSEDEVALAAAAARWRAEVEDGRACYPVHLRAAFRGDTFVGSDVIYERELRLGTQGEAALRTACIGTVLSHPDHRMGGVGRALMQDAVRFARDRKCALLLLGGIPNFYHRFGYVDVLDSTGHTIEQVRITELAPAHAPGGDSVTVRPATEADAPAALALYDRHYGAHPGGFVRSLEEQVRHLRRAARDREYVLAVDGQDRPRGYLKFRTNRARAGEAAADNWAAAYALLRYQMQLLEQAAPAATASEASSASSAPAAPPVPATVTWQMPPNAITYYLLAEHLPVVSESRARPRAGWLARPAHLSTLFRSLVPALEGRWRRAASSWSGRLALYIAGDPVTDQEAGTCELQLAPGHLEVVIASRESGCPARPHDLSVRLLPGALTQLVFGFRPVWWIAAQPGNEVPDAAQPMLDTLFPAEPSWIAATDGF